MEIDSLIEAAAARARAQVEGLPLLDANLWLGKPDFFPLAQEIAPKALGAAISGYGIRGGLVSHWDAVRLSPQDGNQALLDAESVLPQSVWTVWTGLPLAAQEQQPLPGSGDPHPRVRAVRLFPKTHHFQLSPWVVGTLCEWCVAHRLPLLLWHVEIEWEPLHSLAVAFPELQIVVDTQWQKILYHNRDLFSLLDACGNVLVETSNLLGQDFLAWMVRRWGAGRLLYGSFLPASDPRAPLGMILDADISPEEKAQIAGGNLSRILEEVWV